MSASTDIVQIFLNAPPITRYLVTATVVLSVSVWALNIIPYYSVLLSWRTIFTYRRVPQIWRLATTFVLSGPKLDVIFAPYALYIYSKQVETGSPRFSPPGEYATFIVFCCTLILFLAGYLLSASMLLSPLTMAIAYLYSVDSPEHIVNFIIIKIRARNLPWAMLAITLLVNGQYAVLIESMGIVAAHCYDFLTRLWPQYGGGRNIIHAPEFIRRWFYRPAGVGTPRSYGTAFQSRTAPTPRTAPSPPAGGSSWTSGFTSGGGTWGSRGQGQRLGGD